MRPWWTDTIDALRHRWVPAFAGMTIFLRSHPGERRDPLPPEHTGV